MIDLSFFRFVGIKERWLLGVATFVALVYSAGYCVVSLYSRPILDAFTSGAPSEQEQALTTMVFAIVGVTLVQAILSPLQTYCISVTGEGVMRSIRIALFGKMLALPMEAIGPITSGEFASRWSSDVGLVQSLATTRIVSLIRYGVQFLVALVFMFMLQWQATLEALVAALATLLLANLSVAYLSKSSIQLQSLRASVLSIATEALANALFIKVAVRERGVVDRVGAELDNTYEQARKIALVQAGIMPVINIVMTAMFGTLLWLEAKRVIAGDLSIADLGAYVFVLFLLASAAGQLSMTINSTRQGLAGLERVRNLLDMSDEQSSDHGVVPDSLRGDISFEDVSLRYAGSEYDAVHAVSLRVPQGARLVLLGPSGSGKTSMLNLLARAFGPTEGCVQISGRDVTTLRLDAYRRLLGYVPQEPLLFRGSLLDNLRFYKPDATEEEIHQALRAAALAPLLERLDWKTADIGEGGKFLSRGERQRVAIARVFLLDPDIVLLDEPTASLDSESEALVVSTLRHLCAGRTSILVTHRTALARDADMVAVMLDGRIAESGSYHELCARNGIFARLDGLQDASAALESVMA